MKPRLDSVLTCRKPGHALSGLKLTSGILLALSLLLLAPPGALIAQEALQPGEAYLTRFSGTTDEGGQRVINSNGTVGSIVDIRNPGQPPQGQHWINEPQRLPVSAAQVGQVFGVALDDASPPNVYITATAAFGLHRAAGNADWMACGDLARDRVRSGSFPPPLTTNRSVSPTSAWTAGPTPARPWATSPTTSGTDNSMSPIWRPA